VFGQTFVPQMIRASAHADIALTGIVRDKKKPYIHVSPKDRLSLH
jgi:hypothetical protein